VSEWGPEVAGIPDAVTDPFGAICFKLDQILSALNSLATYVMAIESRDDDTAVAAALDGLRNALVVPKIKTVQRDDRGNITKVTETVA
jgi:hypothetical protein